MRKDTVLIVLADDDIENNKIRVNKVVRKNLRIRLGMISILELVKICRFLIPFFSFSNLL